MIQVCHEGKRRQSQNNDVVYERRGAEREGQGDSKTGDNWMVTHLNENGAQKCESQDVQDTWM